PLEVRRINEAERACVKSGQIVLGNVACEDYSAANRRGFDRAQRLAIEPCVFSNQDKLRKLIVRPLALQAFVSMHQTHKILTRLNGADRQHVALFKLITV